MQSRTVERVEAWESRPFAGGADALAALADADFSGAVVADDTWLFFVNGRAVGVYDGTIADLDAAGTRYEAPDISLPLLFAMREGDGETQAQYYTNDTPISETDETLRNANFTGYLELSENVLSGDYYVVYYGGRSFPAAFVGNTPQVLSGDEAFERADDEVGVYDVVSVDLDFPDLPEPETPAETTTAATAASTEDASADDPDDTAAPTDAMADDAEASDTETASDAVAAAEPDAASDTAAAEADAPEPARTDAPLNEADADGEHAARERPDASANEDDSAEERVSDAEDDAAASAEPAARPGAESPGREHVEGEEASADADDAEVFAEEAAWRETTTVPTLAPDEDGQTGRESGGRATEDDANAAARSPGQPSRPSGADERASGRRASAGRDETVERLEAAVREREARIETLESRLDETADDLAERERELADVREERDDLRETVARLEERIEALEAESGGGGGGDASGADDLTPASALAGTNLFVRYDSKADPTLDDVGEADADAIDANVSLEHHTTFDADAATVDGDAYDAFLRGTAAYRFVSWVVRELPFELRETGHQSGLAGLYDAVPEIDRAELAGTVTVEDEEGSGVSREFDVVFRDRMGNPLAVAELNTSRDPVTGDAMEALRDDATAVSELSETLGSALYVTSSFFEPDALSAADEATAGGGFLGRSDKESYVKVARKRGYHLCLVEDRNGSFHLTVPQI